MEVRLPPGTPPERADKALARLLPELPPWRLKEAFKRRDVKRNGQRIPGDAIVSPGDVLSVYVPGEALSPLEIVWEDEGYAVINKRQGMPTQGEGSVEAAWARQRGGEIHACHRLDAQTGGLLLLAKDQQALRRAEQAFAARALSKTYQAIVRGEPAPAAATLHAWLVKDAQAARVSVHDQPARGALPIETRYRTLRAHGGLALLEVDLITGRTHQIRAHLAHIGHPVLGDDKYGDRALNRVHHARRQRLWATRLALWDGRELSVAPDFSLEGEETT